VQTHRNPRQRLSKQPSPDNHRPAELPPPQPNIPGAFGLLQEIIGRVDAMVYATERHFERFGWRCCEEVDATENPVGHLAHLIAAAREASHSAVSAGRMIADDLARNGGAA
jgi:hypothetical protein